jgi:hypothetical protein
MFFCAGNPEERGGMNRREFFSFAAVAPIALPLAAKAAAARSGAVGVLGMTCEFVGLDGAAFEGLAGERPMAFGRATNLAPISVRPSDLIYQLNEGRLPTLTVADQFDADLALLSDDDDSSSFFRVTGTKKSKTQTPIPTADRDDLCQSAQHTEMLSPIPARRLSRSWGPDADVGRGA